MVEHMPHSLRQKRLWQSGSVEHAVSVRRFEAAETDQLQRARALRTSEYLRRGLLTEADLTNGLDVCPDDHRSVHVGMFGPDETMVATVRIILDQPGRPIPVAQDPFRIVPAHRTHGEISRYTVASGWSGIGLVPGAWRELVRIACDLGILDLYAEVEDFLLEALLAVGLPIDIVGEPRWAYHAMNYPVRFEMDTMIAKLMDINPALAIFLADLDCPRSDRFHPHDLRIGPQRIDACRATWGGSRLPPESD